MISLVTKSFLFLAVFILLNTSSVFAQEVLLSPPNPDNSQIQKASTGDGAAGGTGTPNTAGNIGGNGGRGEVIVYTWTG